MTIPVRTENDERFKGIVKTHLFLKEKGKSSESHLLSVIAKHVFQIDVSRVGILYDEAQREHLGAKVAIIPYVPLKPPEN